jgi:lycopene cyclase domain-containing protein
MTYFSILGVFIMPPLVLLAAATILSDVRSRATPGREKIDRWFYPVILIHVGLALLYTTPWDNYLVATGVWWYNPDLVTRITIGWVPIEEYTFFVLMTLLTGLWMVGLRRWVFRTPSRVRFDPAARRAAVAIGVIIWLISTIVLLSGWAPGRYLTLILSWAIIPILPQLWLGADVLWANRRILTLAILPPTLYLWIVDTIALRYGTWVIDPQQTTGITLGVLPIEEMLFFLMTNTIIGFGITLMLSEDLQQRALDMLADFRKRQVRATQE